MAQNIPSRDVPAFLNKQKQNSDEEISELWQQMESLYNKRLWHQLTLKLLEFLKHPCFKEGTGLIDVYNNFVADFEHRVNPLALIEILVPVTRQMRQAGSSIPGCGAAATIELMEKQKEKVKSSPEATILIDIIEGEVQLEDEGNLPAARLVIDRAGKALDELDGVTVVHDRYYKLSSSYQSHCGNHAAYYREALRFLGCTDLSKLTPEENVEWATKIGLAALLGKGIYNFGELLMHDVLKSLEESPNSWLVKLLSACNSGDFATFEQLRPHWSQQADLAAQETFLRQKITLMALVEMSFRRPANERTMSFAEISSATSLPMQEVEHMVMKALSLGLVKGKIDEVNSNVQITWVQPRVLDLDQISSMQVKLDKLTDAVQSVEKLVQVRANDILA